MLSTSSQSEETNSLVEFFNGPGEIDGLISVAYGKIIPNSILEYTPSGVINIHPSLLPRWRGAAPIQYTIFSGDQETGVCIMKASEQLDEGDIYALCNVPVSPEMNSGDLHDELSRISADFMLEQLPDIPL